MLEVHESHAAPVVPTERPEEFVRFLGKAFVPRDAVVEEQDLLQPLSFELPLGLPSCKLID